MVNKNQIEKGLASYLDTEFMPKVHMELWKEFAIATATSIAIKRIGNVIDGYKNNKVLCSLGIIDESGNVDIDILAEQAKIKMPIDGLKIPVPLIGEITVSPSDIDILYQKIIGGP